MGCSRVFMRLCKTLKSTSLPSESLRVTIRPLTAVQIRFTRNRQRSPDFQTLLANTAAEIPRRTACLAARLLGSRLAACRQTPVPAVSQTPTDRTCPPCLETKRIARDIQGFVAEMRNLWRIPGSGALNGHTCHWLRPLGSRHIPSSPSIS